MDLPNLPDDLLIDQFLSVLPLDQVASLCLTHSHIAAICAGERLWTARSFREFPGEARLKPVQMKWRDYYRLLSGKRIPLYYQGDVLMSVPFDPQLFDATLALIKSQINLTGPLNLVFIDSERNPVVVVAYPRMLLSVRHQNYELIEKVVLMPEPDRSQWPLWKSRLDEHDIYAALTSPLGNPPFYGHVSERGFIFIDNSVYRVHQNIRMLSRGKVCHTYTRNDLLRIAQILGLAPLPQDSRDNICTMILTRLQQIGHMI